MTILYIAPRVPVAPFDGGAYCIHHQVRSFIDSGHTVVFAATNTSRQPATLEQVQGLCADNIVVDVDTSVSAFGALRAMFGNRSPRVVGLGRVPYQPARFVSEELAAKIVQRCKTTSFDAIYVEGLVMMWYAWVLRNSLGTECPPILYRAHNVEWRIFRQRSADSNVPVLQRLYLRLLARAMEKYEQVAIRAASVVAPLSVDDSPWFTSVAPFLPVVTIPPGMDVPTEQSDWKGAPNTIGMLGSLEWGPNVEGLKWFVREVLPLVQREVPDAVLRVAGRRPGPDVMSLHDGTSVDIIGPVDNAGEFLRSVQCVAVAIRSGSGVRIKLLEAMANGCAVVATSRGAEGLPVQDNVNVMIAENAEDMSRHCIFLLRSESTRVALGNSARAFIEHSYSWDSCTASIVASLQSVSVSS